MKNDKNTLDIRNEDCGLEIQRLSAPMSVPDWSCPDAKGIQAR